MAACQKTHVLFGDETISISISPEKAERLKSDIAAKILNLKQNNNKFSPLLAELKAIWPRGVFTVRLGFVDKDGFWLIAVINICHSR